MLLDDIARRAYASLLSGQGEPSWRAFMPPHALRNTGDPSRNGPDNETDQVEEAVIVILVSYQEQSIVLT